MRPAHIHRLPPANPDVGDLWSEPLGAGDEYCVWEWTGTVWEYHSDTVPTHGEVRDA